MMTQSSWMGEHGNQDGAGVERDGGPHGRKIRDHLHSRHKEREKRRAEFATRRNGGQSRLRHWKQSEESFAVTG